MGPLSCFLSPFAFSILGQRSRGSREIWLITPEKKKEKVLENFVTLHRKKARLPGWARMSWQTFRSAGGPGMRVRAYVRA